MCIKRYAKYGAIGANLFVERYARKVAEQIGYLEKTIIVPWITTTKTGTATTTSHSRMLSEEQVKILLSSYINYVDTFVRVSNMRKNISF